METTLKWIWAFFLVNFSFAQSDLDRVMKGSELLLGGLSIMKAARSDNHTDSKTIKNICVKNKMGDRISFKITGKDDQENEVKKELVIPKDGKECFLELQKGIYSYEVLLSNKEVFKKGEYRFDDDINIVVKPE